MFAVDPTVEVAREAVEWGADLLVVHHPLFLTPVSSVAADDAQGAHPAHPDRRWLRAADRPHQRRPGGLRRLGVARPGARAHRPRAHPAGAGGTARQGRRLRAGRLGGGRPHGHDRRGRRSARGLRLVHLDRDGRGPVPPARRRLARDRCGRRPRGGRGGPGRGGGAARSSYGGGAGAAGRAPLRGAGLRRGPARRPRAGGHRHRTDRHGRGDDARAARRAGRGGVAGDGPRRTRGRRPAAAGAEGRGVRRGGRLPARRARPTATSTSSSRATCGTTGRPSSSSTTGPPWSMSRTGRPSGPGCRWWRVGCAQALGDRVDTRVSTRCTDPWTFRH